MATRLIHPDQQFSDSAGVPLPAGTLEFFETGTTTPKDTFSDTDLQIANTNPILLNSEGRVDVDVWGEGEFKLVVDPVIETVRTYDPLLGFSIMSGTEANLISDLTAILKASLNTGDQVTVKGYLAIGDSGGGPFTWDSTSTATVNGVTIFASDEGGAGRWSRNADDVITTDMAGVVADGTTDDTTELQNFLSIGGELLVRKGTGLILTGNVTIPSNTRLTFEPGSGLKLKDSQDDHLLENSDTVGGNTNIHIFGGEFDGNKANQTTLVDADGVRFENVTNSSINDVYVHDTENTGVSVQDSVGVKVIRPLVEDCGTPNVLNSGDGINIRQCVDCHVVGPTVRRVSRIGLLFKGTVTTPTTDCTHTGGGTFEDMGEVGISCEDFVNDVSISQFLIKTTGLNTAGSTKSGMTLGKPSMFNITLSDGVIRDAGGFGIELVGGLTNITIRDIWIDTPATDGIIGNVSDNAGGGGGVVGGGYRGLYITNVRVTNGGRDGITVRPAATNPVDPDNISLDVVIRDCTVDDNVRVNFSFLSCEGIKVINCNADGVGQTTVSDAIFFRDCDKASVQGGVLNDYPRSGVVMEASSLTTITKCTVMGVIFDGSNIGIRVAECTGSAFMNNTIRNLTLGASVGIQTQTTSDDNVISGNDLRNAFTPFSLVGTNLTIANVPAEEQFTITNDVTDRVYDANTVTVAELADVVATYIKDNGAA